MTNTANSSWNWAVNNSQVGQLRAGTGHVRHTLRASSARLERNTAMTNTTAAQLGPVSTWNWG